MGLLSRRTQPGVPRRRQSAQPTRTDDVSRSDSSTIFRRNRTLTGSTSSRVNAFGELRADLTSPRVEVHKLAQHRRRLGVLFVGVVAAVTFLGFLLSQFSATVQVVAVDTATDSQITDRISYEKTVQEYFSGNPFDRFRFALHIPALTQYMQESHPEIEDIQQVGFGSQIGQSIIRVVLRTPVASWNIGNERLYVDAHGIAFTKNYTTAPIVQITDNSGVDTTAGSAVASNRLLTFVGRVVSESQKAGLSIDEVVLPQDTTRQLELHIKDYTTPIKLSVDRGVGEQVEDMVHALNYFRQTGQTPSYIDVRVSGKAFYK